RDLRLPTRPAPRQERQLRTVPAPRARQDSTGREHHTMTAPTIDLSWATFTEHEEREPCEGCSAQATHAGIYRLLAGSCTHLERLYCLTHAANTSAAVRPWGGEARCGYCSQPSRIRLIRMAPITSR